MNFKDKIIRFLYGRNGFDKFSQVLFWAYLFIWFLNLFLKSSILNLLSLALFFYLIFRVFSKNIYKRRAENAIFLRYWCKIEKFYKFNKVKLKEIKIHRYRRCPHCHVMLRLKRKVGKHTVLCPVCKKEFYIRIIV